MAEDLKWFRGRAPKGPSYYPGPLVRRIESGVFLSVGSPDLSKAVVEDLWVAADKEVDLVIGLQDNDATPFKAVPDDAR
jgi:hypothetical protein